MLQEQGPLLISADGGLMRNPYSWTKQANLLILESPGGVGYSFCAAMKTGGNCNNTDVTTAAAARAALQDFFVKLFPEFKDNEFFITGIAVGDPCTDYPSQHESMDMLWYAHKHGFIPDGDFDFLWNNCSMRHPSLLTQGAWRREAGKWAVRESLQGDLKGECKLAYRRFLATSSRGISQSWPKAYINELSLFSDASVLDWKAPKTLDYYTSHWMNRPDVKKALHVEEAPVKSWPGPADGWQYTSSWNACNNAPGKASMVDFYRYIAPKMRTTIVFNGDTDPCVSYEGTRNAIEKVNFAILPGGNYRPWFYNKSAASIDTLQKKPNLFGPNLELRDAGAQFGGHVVNYEHGLSFATVHGSGHMVPQFRPQAAERLLNRLLSGSNFAPFLPTDTELMGMSDDAFDKSVDDWTVKAEADVAGKVGKVEQLIV
ncbi:unnamed protein product [Effrenium voratum]|uniref:Serine carboxypeptidase n=1 Tax=Effrenium voratum TaxID=2562239 RepID=A0AA36JGR0_9DINO|nr:unnamed protein product [Effrenium voratum]